MNIEQEIIKAIANGLNYECVVEKMIDGQLRLGVCEPDMLPLQTRELGGWVLLDDSSRSAQYQINMTLDEDTVKMRLPGYAASKILYRELKKSGMDHEVDDKHCDSAYHFSYSIHDADFIDRINQTIEEFVVPTYVKKREKWKLEEPDIRNVICVAS